MRLVLIASDPREFLGVLTHTHDVHLTEEQVHWARQARLEGHAVLMVANGAGPQRAALAADAAAKFRPDALVSLGFCGAAAPDLSAAEVVVATEVVCEEAAYPSDPLPSGLPHKLGVVRTLDHIAENSEEKAHWYRMGATAVDMEAGAVAQRAQASSLRFHCVKAVTDLAGETLENDLNSALRDDGHFDTIKILGSTLRQPFIRVPELFRLRSRSAQAAHALGDFLADCRF